jgi:hypothetical protein
VGRWIRKQITESADEQLNDMGTTRLGPFLWEDRASSDAVETASIQITSIPKKAKLDASLVACGNQYICNLIGNC